MTPPKENVSGKMAGLTADLNAEDSARLLIESARDYAIFLLSPQGYVRSWNQGAERIKGYTAEEIIGQHFSRFYPRDAIDRGWPTRELELAQSDGRFEDEGWRIRKDGTPFWANVVITALRGKNGELLGFSKITRDLTERRRHEEQLRESEERFRLLVEGVSDYAIILLNPEGFINSWNVGARRIQGFTLEEVIGRHFSIFYPPEAVADGAPLRLLKLARENGRAANEGWRIRKDGSRYWANVVITALYNRDGIHRGFAKVTQDMTQLRRIELLEESGQRVNEFLAMLAHELRNPLAPIRNAVELMRTKDVEDPTIQWSRDVIERQMGHLSRLVDDLLDVSRITNGRLILQREQLDLAAVLDRAVESSRPLIEARHQSLEIQYPEKPIHVDGDLIRLSQVVVNLLNNAAKYTPSGGRIWLKAERETGVAAIRVGDTGMGIPPDLRMRIFDLFTQGARTMDRSEGGLGIGLTIVERLVALHGGTIEVLSEGAHKGSEFIVRIPECDARPAATTIPTDAPTASKGVRRRVLVVDDNGDSTESLTLLLGTWGHEALGARGGAEALSIAERFRPEAVLLDIGLPEMDGYEVARRLRELPGLRETTLVAMTGYGQEEDRLRSRDAGFARHLVKPVDPQTLRNLIETLPS